MGGSACRSVVAALSWRAGDTITFVKIVLTMILMAGAFAAGWYGRAMHDGEPAPSGTRWSAMSPEARAVATCSAERPWEPIRSVTRASADHSRP